jgi:hypothetical protein
MLLVRLGINSTRDVWKFAKLDSPRRLVLFWQNFQTSLVLLIPNCTRHRMITYTNHASLHLPLGCALSLCFLFTNSEAWWSKTIFYCWKVLVRNPAPSIPE